MALIRREGTYDADAVRYVHLKAFKTSVEADLVDKLRLREEPMISLVGIEDGRIVGHILFSPVTIDFTGGTHPAIGLGPVAVLPEYQGRGIGSALVEAGLEECRDAGHKVVVVLGDPAFYRKFGFRSSKPLGVEYEMDVPEEVFMVVELSVEALVGIQGVVRYLPDFSDI